MSRRIQIGALAVVAATLVSIFCLPWQPRHQGKTLSQWLKSLDKTPIQFLELEPMPDQPAVDAFRAIGSNAIPFLRAELRAKDSRLKKNLIQWLKKQSFIKIQLTPAEVRHQRAVSACHVLGPVAKELVPELSTLLNSAYDPVYESFALAAVRPPGLASLTYSMKSNNKWVRTRAASAFRYVRYDAEAAIPALIKCLDDEAAQVRSEAAEALGHIGKRADSVVPILVRNLDDPDSTVRSVTADALGFFGEHAKAAVPALIKKIEEDAEVRPWASMAVKKIDPQAASEAGVK